MLSAVIRGRGAVSGPVLARLLATHARACPKLNELHDNPGASRRVSANISRFVQKLAHFRCLVGVRGFVRIGAFFHLVCRVRAVCSELCSPNPRAVVQAQAKARLPPGVTRAVGRVQAAVSGLGLKADKPRCTCGSPSTVSNGPSCNNH